MPEEYHLVVTTPFGDYARGAVIKDSQTVAAILAGDQHDNVVRIRPQPEVPDPASAAEPPTDPEKAPDAHE